MADTLPYILRPAIRSLAARGRAQIEREVFGHPSRLWRLHLVLLRALGAISIGIFSAGIAVFATVIVLNFIFHFSPT